MVPARLLQPQLYTENRFGLPTNAPYFQLLLFLSHVFTSASLPAAFSFLPRLLPNLPSASLPRPCPNPAPFFIPPLPFSFPPQSRAPLRRPRVFVHFVHPHSPPFHPAAASARWGHSALPLLFLLDRRACASVLRSRRRRRPRCSGRAIDAVLLAASAGAPPLQSRCSRPGKGRNLLATCIEKPPYTRAVGIWPWSSIWRSQGPRFGTFTTAAFVSIASCSLRHLFCLPLSSSAMQVSILLFPAVESKAALRVPVPASSSFGLWTIPLLFFAAVPCLHLFLILGA